MTTERPIHRAAIERLLRQFPVVGVIGARQVGKTTLARQIADRWRGPAAHFDLEDARDLARLAEPALALGSLQGLVVLDEIHRRPELFPLLRVLADRPRVKTRFLVLGSATPELLRQSSETLAGRIGYYELPGLSLQEVGAEALDRLWLRGGFPRAYLARSAAESTAWRTNFIRTFLERDLPGFGVRTSPTTMGRFWSMLAHYHGQVLNGSELGRALGVADTTVRHYLDVLCDTFVVRQLTPWHANIGKRQIKAPKVYVADSGLLHTLLGLSSRNDVDRHPKLGASWEGFILESLIGHLGIDRRELFFWGTHAGAELDLLRVHRGRRRGFEIKRTSTPKVTPSMRTAVEDLKLDRLDVIHAGDHTFPLGPKIRAVAAGRLLIDLEP